MASSVSIIPRRVPSVKSLERIVDWRSNQCITTEQAKAIRKILLEGKSPYSALKAVNELLDAHGVEFIAAGRNAKSPSLRFVNLGETYGTTLILVGSSYWSVSSWGNYVERGNYE